MSEELKTVTEAAPPSVDAQMEAARAREEKVVVKVRLSDLREKAAKYLGERLNSKEAAELAAQGLVEVFEAKSHRSRPRPELPEPENGSGNGSGNGKGNGNGRRGALSWATEESMTEKFRAKRTLQGLKLALAGHQPIVRLVVAERLHGLRSIDDIATRYELTREEVLDILTRMRFWVSRFTDSFRDDWYWTDSKQKYVIPEHKLAPKKRARR